jgi:hypothetical protein
VDASSAPPMLGILARGTQGLRLMREMN